MLIPILDKNMHGYLSTDITCSKKRTASLIRAKLKENCELQGTDNVQGQIAIHIFAPIEATSTFHSLPLTRNKQWSSTKFIKSELTK